MLQKDLNFLPRLARGIAFVTTNAVLVRKSRRTFGTNKPKAHHRPTVHLKGVTHYTLQTKACEKEYEQIVRTPFVFLCKQNLLYGRHPLGRIFYILFFISDSDLGNLELDLASEVGGSYDTVDDSLIVDNLA